MCGFAGEYVFGATAPADVQLARRMAAKLVHRGPDEQGAFLSSDGRCAIGFRRLAVIDPEGSHQPMSSEDGKVTVAFNGEIYNYPSLRGDLSNTGAVFHSRGDTETLLHLYRRHGEQFVNHLAGMFAFAIYDAQRGQLLLARDRLGQKPLWYALLPDRVVFASEAKALLQHPKVDRSMDMLAIQQYLLLGYIPAPRTAWSNIRKLRPAHYLCFDSTAHSPQRYWRAEPTEQPTAREDRLENIRESLQNAVEKRMIADVPLGALLSGGIDSGIIVGLMCRIAGKAGGVKTFTGGFEDATFDERPLARLTAERFGCEHTELLIEAAPLEAIDQLTEMYDEPFGDSSALPTWLVCRAARQQVTVALCGDGGDEVFGGYDRYRAMFLGETMGPAHFTAVRLAAWLARPWAGQGERSLLRRLIRFSDGLTLPPALQYLKYRALFDPGDLSRLVTAEFLAATGEDAAAEWFCELYESQDAPDELTRAQRHDFETYLPDDLLVKADIASMACSLELRAPMLDHDLVGVGLSLPAEMKFGGHVGKVALREAFSDLLPAELVRQRKRGFGVPLGRWLRAELRETLLETLTDPGFLAKGIVRPEAVVGLMNDHFSGRADHSHRLWALLMLGRWLARQG